MTTAVIALLVVVLLAVLAVASWFAVEGVNRRPEYGAVALFVWLATLVLFVERQDFFVRGVAGINIAIPDVLCAFLGLVAALRFIRGFARIAPALLMPLCLFVGMLVLSYVRGLATFGLQRATNEFREFFYFLTALTFALSFPPGKLATKIPLVGVIGGTLLVIVAIVRLSMLAGYKLEERAVPSYAALAIGQAFFLGWYWLKVSAHPRLWRWPIFGFLPFAVLMLHRSVWVALAGGLLALVAWDREGRWRFLRMLLVGGVISGLLVTFFFGQEIVAALEDAVAEATSSEESTFIWRMEGWQALLRPSSGWDVPSLVIGQPMGSGYARVLGNSVVNMPEIESGIIPHNYYLSMLLRGGVVGTLAFLAFYFKLVKILLARAGRNKSTAFPACFTLILITQLIYYVPYSADLIQGLFLGGAGALAAATLPLHETDAI